MFSLSVVMFAYNEAENLEPVVEETLHDLHAMVKERLISGFQLVLVNDGSKDDSQGVIDRLAATHSEILALDHGTNRGIGAAVKTGFSGARCDLVTILPADGQVTTDAIRRLLPAIQDGADMALGHYTQRGEVDGLFRLALSRGLRFGMRVALGTKRPMDGVYLFHRRLLTALPLKSETFFVNLEFPVRAIREGYDVRSVPVEVAARRSGDSKVVGLRRIAKVATEVVKFRVHLIDEQVTGK